MNEHDEEWRELQQQIERKQQYAKMLASFYTEQKNYEKSVKECKEKLEFAQKDFDNLKRKKVVSFFHTIAGKKEKQIEIEFARVQEAKEKYRIMTEKLNAVTDTIEHYEAELKRLKDKAEQHQFALDAKAEKIKSSHGEGAAEILQLEAEMGQYISRKKEVQEAAALGRTIIGRGEEVILKIEKTLEPIRLGSKQGGRTSSSVEELKVDPINALQTELTAFLEKCNHMTQQSESGTKLQELVQFKEYLSMLSLENLREEEQANQTIKEIKDGKREMEEALKLLEKKKKVMELKITDVKGKINEVVINVSPF